MFKEHDRAVLLVSLPKDGLMPGDVGTIVHLYGESQAYEMEFVSLDGNTQAVVTVEAQQIRPVSGRDMPHVREMQMT